MFVDWCIVKLIILNMERYEVMRDIGSGNFGVAKLVRDKWTSELLAVKFIERGQKVCSLSSLSLSISFDWEVFNLCF